MAISLIRAFIVTFFLQVWPAAAQNVFTSDIDNFWKAFDSVKTVTDSAKRVEIIQHVYVDKGTEGLRAFMKARDYSAALWANLIQSYPKFCIHPAEYNRRQVKSGID